MRLLVKSGLNVFGRFFVAAIKMCGAADVHLSRALGFFSVELFGCLVEVGYKFFMIPKGAGHPSTFDVSQPFGQLGINGFTLRGGVLVICGREFGTVNHQSGRDDDFAALKSEVHQITFGKAGLTPDSGGDGDLALVLNLACGVHKAIRD